MTSDIHNRGQIQLFILHPSVNYKQDISHTVGLSQNVESFMTEILWLQRSKSNLHFYTFTI